MILNTFPRIFCLVLAVVLPVAASTVVYTGSGGNIRVASFDSTGGIAPGVTTFTIPVTETFAVANGNSVTVSLTGLNYPYAGDLAATLTLEDANGHDVASGDIFNRIGSSGPNSPGYAAGFGGNYTFNSTFPGDLWTAAAPLGSGDIIPTGQYHPSTAFTGMNDGLSALFDGQPVNGVWKLTIYDYFMPFYQQPFQYMPWMADWSVVVEAGTQVTPAPFVTEAPEPSTTASLILATGLLFLVWRRRVRVSPLLK